MSRELEDPFDIEERLPVTPAVQKSSVTPVKNIFEPPKVIKAFRRLNVQVIINNMDHEK